MTGFSAQRDDDYIDFEFPIKLIATRSWVIPAHPVFFPIQKFLPVASPPKFILILI